MKKLTKILLCLIMIFTLTFPLISCGGMEEAEAKALVEKIVKRSVNLNEILYGKDGGHGMVFRDLNGRLCLTIHQPNSSPNERMKIFTLKDNGERLVLEFYPDNK